MGRRHRLPPDSAATLDELTGPCSRDQGPAPLVIIGAGSFLGDLINLVREYPEFSILGILDPSPILRGQFVQDIPILGWLGDIPNHVRNAVIGNPVHSPAFDRGSVFRLLKMKGVHLPILKAGTSKCSNDVILRAGTCLLPACTVSSGAQLGLNVLVGSNCQIASIGSLADHQTVAPDTIWDSTDVEKTAITSNPSAEAALATGDEPIQTTMKRLNRSRLEIILVADNDNKLVGTVTDGDIRRGILAGIDVDQPVSMIMNPNPVTVRIGTPGAEMLRIMREHSIRHLPVVDSGNHPIGLERLESLVDNISECNAVVMAGGMGSRLKPLTDNLPKPLIQVAGRPILDHILTGLHAEGIEEVVLALNHLGGKIRDHIGDGSRYGTRVNYLTERKRLGTAGALSLLRPRPRKPFLVMNGDLLTGLSFSKLLQFQRDHNYTMVICVRQHSLQVPYGVVEIRDGEVLALREKPIYRHFINAGVYVLTPSCLDHLPKDQYYDMTDLIGTLVSSGERVGVFPVIEYWRDVGTHADLAAAMAEQDISGPGSNKPPTTEAWPSEVAS